ncbi:MAG: FprA family A-type flavoprotein [Treponema sp.]|jgi:flavorubredoxin|nr:FprA family A-type flavoprotein [Treponema sp.]
MKSFRISHSVFCIYADIEGCPGLFEGIWTIKESGVSLNCFVVKGEKIALIDLTSDWTNASEQVVSALASLDLSLKDIDFLILNHLEPDHTGFLRDFRRENPRCEIVSTAKGVNLLKSFYNINEGVHAVKDGDTLDLGGDHILSFFETPNVHWPETMVTWDAATGVLFSCDAFGSFGKLGGRVFDDEFTDAEHAAFEKESLRYYANIISSFSLFTEKAIEKLKPLDIKCIAPSHGVVWRKNPQVIIDRYAKYASYAKAGEKEITIVWSSMYGNTKVGLDTVIRGIEQEGVPYSIHHAPDEDVSYILADAYKNAGLVVAMPTYEYAMFPPMAYVIDLFRRKHIFNKTVLRIGSFGWVGGAKKEYETAIMPLKWNSLESHEWAGFPTETDLLVLKEKGRELARKVLGLDNPSA